MAAGHPRCGARQRSATAGTGDPTNIPEIREELRNAGREDEPFEFSTITLQGPVPLDQLEQLAAMGVHRVVVTPWVGTRVGEVGREGLAAVEQYARDLGLSAVKRPTCVNKPRYDLAS